MPSMTLEQGLNSAVKLQRAGRLDEAENLYRQILTQHSDCADALHLLGVLCAQRGRSAEALENIRKAIRLHPNVPGFHINLGNVLLAAGNAGHAAEAYREAISLQPNNAVYHNSLGTALSALGRFGDAIESYRAAIAIEPNFADAWSNLANALHETGKYPEAIAATQRAITLRPTFADAIAIQANCLRDSGRSDESIEQYRKAISLRSNLPEIYVNLALALANRRRFDEAIAAIDTALKLRPNWSLAWSNRAKTLRDHGRLADATASARRALEISPELGEAQINLTGCLMDSGDIDEALKSVHRALELAPQNSTAHNLAANVLKEAGAVTEAIAELDRALELNPDDAAFHSNKLYLMEFDPRADPAALFAEQRKWNERHAVPRKKHDRPHDNDRTHDRRLRIGYVSPYFRDHAESFFVVPLLESHDHDCFEIFCYSDADHPDAVTARIRRAANVWRSTVGFSHEELADLIRRDRIDVLIDLSMHMAFNRALTFAQKPAPVQTAWLAYPGGTGLDAMDYRITDPWIDPAGTDESHYREKSIRLPDSWVCFDPLADVPSLPPRASGPICFGSLNNPCKHNTPLLEIWARVLDAVPDSTLLLQATSQFQRDRSMQLFGSHGIDSKRIQFAPRCSRDEYRTLYQRIDICLDPLPYNGITTSCDALWLGVPVITLAGKHAAGRAGTSLLNNIGLGELVATDQDDFVRIAESLAGDSSHLADLRRTLPERMRASPLMDAHGFARNMEAAYRRMWSEWCDGGD
jgi:protein O-GlcNAc transferase